MRTSEEDRVENTCEVLTAENFSKLTTNPKTDAGTGDEENTQWHKSQKTYLQGHDI